MRGAEYADLHIERQNLSTRTGMRRMTRLTNAFFKKVGKPASCLLSMVCVQQFLSGSQTESDPAIESDITNRVLELGELLI